MGRYGRDDGLQFLNDHAPPEFQFEEQDNEAKAFLESFQYTVHLVDRQAKYRVRWLFSATRSALKAPPSPSLSAISLLELQPRERAGL